MFQTMPRPINAEGGGKFHTVTIPEGTSDTINLNFEVKTIIFADTVVSNTGYSGVWSSNFNFTGKDTYFVYIRNPRNDIGSNTIGSSGARIQSISSDGKTVAVYSSSGTGNTTFWFYGDDN